MSSDKIAAIKDAMPNLYPINKPNGSLNAVLSAFGTLDNSIGNEIVNIKKNVFLETAEGVFLDRLGNNYGVVRPRGLPDSNFRDIIRHVAFQPKSIINIIRQVLEDIFGPSDGVNWDVFHGVVPGEIIVVLRNVSLPRQLTDATYVHPATKNFDIEYTGTEPRASVIVTTDRLITQFQLGTLDGGGSPILAGAGSLLTNNDLSSLPASGTLILDRGTTDEETIAYSSRTTDTFTLVGTTSNDHADGSPWGDIDLNLGFTANPFVDDLATAVNAAADYVATNIRVDAATTASTEIGQVFDVGIKGEPFKLYTLIEGGPPTSGKYFGDYIRPNSADRGFDADGTNPSGADSADGTDPDNPIYYIVIVAGEDLTAPQQLLLFVKAAGIQVRIETL